MSSKELAGFDADLAYIAHIVQYYYNNDIFEFELPSKVCTVFGDLCVFCVFACYSFLS